MPPAHPLHAADAFRRAFRVAPERALALQRGGAALYGWNTPAMDGFELPETDELVLALHLGGSRAVRAVTDHGLSQTRSTPGLVTLLPPGRTFAFRTAGAIRVATLHLPRALDPATRLVADAQLRFAFHDPYVSAAMQSLLQASASPLPLRPDYLERVMDALLCHLAQLADWAGASGLGPQAMGVPAPLQPVLEHIDTHLHAPLTVRELAARAGMGRSRFVESFRACMGESPHRYVMQRRVQAAQRLLADPHLDLARIAQDTGFSSQSHFTRVFRLLAGCTPQRFRERH